MVLNTLEEVFLLALEDQGGHPPDHAGVLARAGCCLHWDFSTFKTFCFISSLAAWHNREENWPVAKFISHVNMKMIEQRVFHGSHPPARPNKPAS